MVSIQVYLANDVDKLSYVLGHMSTFDPAQLRTVAVMVGLEPVYASAEELGAALTARHGGSFVGTRTAARALTIAIGPLELRGFVRGAIDEFVVGKVKNYHMKVRALKKLEEQKTSYGMATPPYIITQIEDGHLELSDLVTDIARHLGDTEMDVPVSFEKVYILGNIRTLLTEALNEEELRRKCYDDSAFRPVYDKFARSTNKPEMIDMMLEHAEKMMLIDALLDWVKTQNKSRYEKHAPYWQK